MRLNPAELLPFLAFLGVVHVEVSIQSVMNPLLQSDAKLRGVEPSIGEERITFFEKARGRRGVAGPSVHRGERLGRPPAEGNREAAVAGTCLVAQGGARFHWHANAYTSRN
jgi:hypothetical protein